MQVEMLKQCCSLELGLNLSLPEFSRHDNVKLKYKHLFLGLSNHDSHRTLYVFSCRHVQIENKTSYTLATLANGSMQLTIVAKDSHWLRKGPSWAGVG